MFSIFEAIGAGLIVGFVILMQYLHIRELKRDVASVKKAMAFQSHIEKNLRKALELLKPGSYDLVKELAGQEWEEAHLVDGVYDFTSSRVPTHIPDLWTSAMTQCLVFPSGAGRQDVTNHEQPAQPEQVDETPVPASSVEPKPATEKSRTFRTVKYADDGWGELEVPAALRRAQGRREK